MEKFEKMKKLMDMAAIDPPPPECCCNCRRKLDPYQLFDDNIEDIANSLAQIMLICGINTTKSYNSKPIIKRAFVYHEKLRTQCPADSARAMHLNREDMLQALLIRCEMQRIEAMLSYAIVKRAFKAFFHGKPPRTISNPIIDAMAVHTQESAWLHAAYKTARIFDNYKAAFFWAHKSYEKQINLVYRELFKRMRTRADPLMVPGCTCRGCTKHLVPGHHKAGEPPRERYQLSECANLPEACMLCGLQVPHMKTNVKVKPPRPVLNHELKIPRCEKCNSPFLICECNIDQLTGEQYGECGQDSYKVKWYRLDQQPQSAADVEKLESGNEPVEQSIGREDHHCPIDCQRDSSESSDVCKEQEKPQIDSESDDEFTSCTGEEQDVVAKLEDYLNKLWAEELAAKNNPKTFMPSPSQSLDKRCQSCMRQ